MVRPPSTVPSGNTRLITKRNEGNKNCARRCTHASDMPRMREKRGRRVLLYALGAQSIRVVRLGGENYANVYCAF